jgi:hypothetical protein
MKRLQIVLCLSLFFLGTQALSAQSGGLKYLWGKWMADLRKTPYTFGLGWNVVEDSGKPWKGLFAAKRSWAIPPYPSRLYVEKEYRDGFSFDLSLAYNRYVSGKTINNHVINGTYSFFSVDANGRYDLNKLYDLNKAIFKEQKIFNIYAVQGWGYTYRALAPNISVFTCNVGLGINVWAYKNWGVNIQSVGKFGLKAPLIRTSSNYFQHTIGVIYKFQPKPLSLGKRYKFKKKEIKPKL